MLKRISAFVLVALVMVSCGSGVSAGVGECGAAFCFALAHTSPFAENDLPAFLVGALSVLGCGGLCVA